MKKIKISFRTDRFPPNPWALTYVVVECPDLEHARRNAFALVLQECAKIDPQFMAAVRTIDVTDVCEEKEGSPVATNIKPFTKSTWYESDREFAAVHLVLNELHKAQSQYPEWPADPIHQAAIVQEEAGELVRASLQCVYEPGRTSLAHVQREAVQVGAMAIRLLLEIDEQVDPTKSISYGKEVEA